MNIFFKKYIIILISLILILSGCTSSKQISKTSQKNTFATDDQINLGAISTDNFDNGKMWTFEYPPLKFFKEEYDFSPSQKWFDDVRMSALRYGNICSASFVSEDGLIMTNYHCARESLGEVFSEKENIDSTGFLAETLEDERKVPGLFVDQLVLIKDVTDEIQKAAGKGKTDAEKDFLQKAKIKEIEDEQKEATGLKISVTPLFNGGKYSLYGYKTYEDVRLVFVPESQAAYFGGDYDNFTYPRYNLDFAFFRVYQNGEPLKTKHYFKWSSSGPTQNEPIFVIGNPASTTRLYTVAQLKYLRDVTYSNALEFLDGIIDTYEKLIEENPERKNELTDKLLSYTNSRKVYEGMLNALKDSILIQKKKDFEEQFKSAVLSNPELKKYGNIWDKIAANRKEKAKTKNELSALSLNIANSSEYFIIAEDLINLAEELKLPESERLEIYKGNDLDSTVNNIFPKDFNYEMSRQELIEQLSFMRDNLNNDLINKITNGKYGEDAADYMIDNSSIIDEKKIKKLIDKGPDAILNSDDPFIYFVIHSEKIEDELRLTSSKLENENEILSEKLGKLFVHIYGTSVSPDGTFTLRISDGVLKEYPYNGTIAPPITTFYGMYDRYYSFNKDFPWNLPKKWENPPENFDLSTPFNFVSTNDIMSGNSGSAVINENKEIVGLAFDGNMESLAGSFIFLPEKNRMIALHSTAIIESLGKIYKAFRLRDELKNGKLDKE